MYVRQKTLQYLPVHIGQTKNITVPPYLYTLDTQYYSTALLIYVRHITLQHRRVYLRQKNIIIVTPCLNASDTQH